MPAQKTNERILTLRGNVENFADYLADFGLTSVAVVHTAIEIEQHIGAVYDTVHYRRHDKGCGHVKDRMLFDKYG